MVKKFGYHKLKNHVKLYKLRTAQFMLPITEYGMLFREFTLKMPGTYWSAIAHIENIDKIGVKYEAEIKPEMWAKVKAQLEDGKYKELPYGANLYIMMLGTELEIA